MKMQPFYNKTLDRWGRIVCGPLLAIACFVFLPTRYSGPEGDLIALTNAGRATLAVMVWMAAWWLTEAIHISATALLPVVVFPIIGIRSIEQAASPYASPLIFLFMGGFMLALSMQRWRLDRRIALLTLKLVGTKPAHMVGGFMLVTAVLSAFVSNTATAAMMLPIALSVIGLVERQHPRKDNDGSPFEKHFSLCLLISIAYAASIGGVATIIGTPPNALLVGFLKSSIQNQYRTDISYVQWLAWGIPMSALFLPIGWLLLTRLIYPLKRQAISGGRALIREEITKLGKIKPGEWITFFVFCLVAAGWISRPLLQDLNIQLSGTTLIPFSGLTDAGIAIAGGVLLFIVPVDRKASSFTMDWNNAKKLPWGILILFGGGLSLASAVSATGVAEFIAAQAGRLGRFPEYILVIGVALMVVFLTELTSNTASTAALLPVLASLAVGLSVHPYLLLFPVALGASCAFMLPVATPPNAIVFGSDRLTISQMARAGFWFNLVSVILVTLVTLFIVRWMTGIADTV